MFGWNVDKTKVKAGAPQRERDVCTAASGDECQNGEPGSGVGSPEELGHMRSVAIDQSTGDLYVLTPQYHRVEMLTGAGEFVWTAGEQVNETEDLASGTEAQRNLCTAASKDTCKAGVESPAESKAPDAFKVSEAGFGNLLAVGGPGDLLYVADEGRVQEIKASGEWEGEVELAQISRSARASAVAVDPAGDVFVGDPATPGVREFNTSKQLQSQVIGPAGANTQVDGLALDAYGRLGILSEEATGPNSEIRKTLGLLYTTAGAKVSSFAPPSSSLGESHSLTFASASAPLPDQLYVPEARGGRQEIEAYEPVVAPVILTCPVAAQPTGTSAELCGEVNPNGTTTAGFFQYGTTTALGSRTASAFEGSGNALVPMSVEATELEPNEHYYYAAAAEATVNGRKLLVAGETMQFATPSVSQQVLGQPSALFVGVESAVLDASLNPEHTGTSYHFQYGPCPALNGCAGVLSTPASASSAYGTVEDIQEVVGLAQATTYSYRLVTERSGESPILGPEGSFTTASTPVLRASTGPVDNVTAASATISGSVDPGGQPASYTFEMGIYNGAGTQFATVATGSAGPAPAAESAGLSGLLPGLTYAYRITVASGYGSATSAPSTFTTLGLPTVIAEPVPLPMLAIPKIAFPKPGPKCNGKRNKKGVCVKPTRHHKKKKKNSRQPRRKRG
jgi:hypothetical protein